MVDHDMFLPIQIASSCNKLRYSFPLLDIPTSYHIAEKLYSTDYMSRVVLCFKGIIILKIAYAAPTVRLPELRSSLHATYSLCEGATQRLRETPLTVR